MQTHLVIGRLLPLTLLLSLKGERKELPQQCPLRVRVAQKLPLILAFSPLGERGCCDAKGFPPPRE